MNRVIKKHTLVNLVMLFSLAAIIFGTTFVFAAEDSSSKSGAVQEMNAHLQTQQTPANIDYTFDARWENKDSSNAGNYHYENSNTKKLFVTPTNNETKTALWGASLKVNQDSKGTIPAGKVKITVPSFLLENWGTSSNNKLVNVNHEMKPEASMNWQMVEAPAHSSSSDFNYTNNNNGTYTLTNYKDLSGSFTLDFTQSFSFVPSYIKVNAQGRLEKDFPIHLEMDTTGDGSFNVNETKTLSLDLQNTLNKGSVALSVARKNNEKGSYLNWQESWGKRPADDDGNSYFYVIWFADYMRGANSSLPFTSTITDTGSQGEVVGTAYYTWHDNTFQYNLDTSYPNIAASVGPKAYRQYSGGESPHFSDVLYSSSRFQVASMQPHITQAILKRYPISLIEGKSASELRENGIELSDSVRVNEVADNGQQDSVSASNKEKVYFYLGEGSFGKYNYTSSLLDVQGGRSLLLKGDSVRVASSWERRSYSWRTNAVVRKPNSQEKSAEAWQANISEDAPYYISANFSDVRSANLGDLVASNQAIKLQDSDYYYRGFDIALKEFDSVATPLGEDVGSEISDYENMKPVEIWVRKAGSSTFEHYADFKKTGKKSAEVTDTKGNKLGRTINEATAQLYPFPENVVAVQYRHNTNAFEADITSYESLVLKPSDNIKNLLNASKQANKQSLVASAATLVSNGAHEEKSWTQPLEVTTFYLTDLNISTTANIWVGDLTDVKEESLQKREVAVFNKNSAFGIVEDITGGGRSDLEIYKSYALNKGSFYYLLPKGTYADISNAWLKLSWSWSYGKGSIIPKENYQVKLLDNYENSGMTMLVVDYVVPEELMNFSLGDPQVWFGFDLCNTYSNIVDRGSDPLTSLAFVNDNEAVDINIPRNQSTPDALKFKDRYEYLFNTHQGNILFTQKNRKLRRCYGCAIRLY